MITYNKEENVNSQGWNLLLVRTTSEHHDWTIKLFMKARSAIEQGISLVLCTFLRKWF